MHRLGLAFAAGFALGAVRPKPETAVPETPRPPLVIPPVLYKSCRTKAARDAAVTVRKMWDQWDDETSTFVVTTDVPVANIAVPGVQGKFEPGRGFVIHVPYLGLWRTSHNAAVTQLELLGPDVEVTLPDGTVHVVPWPIDDHLLI
jgi:hypothetical protein